jgi:hypothetical protein
VSGTLAWTLFFTLWLPYQDYGNSYRELVADMKAHFPQGSHCIANRDLGEPQRAMLEYFGGIVTRSESSPEASACNLLIVQQQGYQEPLPEHDAGWLPLWRGARPGDVNERFWLFGSAEMVLQAQHEKIDSRVGVSHAAVRKVLQPRRDVVVLEPVAEADMVTELEARAEGEVPRDVRVGEDVKADRALEERPALRGRVAKDRRQPDVVHGTGVPAPAADR